MELIAFDASKSQKSRKSSPLSDPSYHHPATNTSYTTASSTRRAGAAYACPPFFDRHELNLILQSYSRKVMSGDWLDYAITHEDSGAVFAIYGRLTEVPLFTIRKQSRSGKHGQRYELSAHGKILRHDRNLSTVLKYLEARTPFLVKS